MLRLHSVLVCGWGCQHVAGVVPGGGWQSSRQPGWGGCIAALLDWLPALFIAWPGSRLASRVMIQRCSGERSSGHLTIATAALPIVKDTSKEQNIVVGCKVLHWCKPPLVPLPSHVVRQAGNEGPASPCASSQSKGAPSSPGQASSLGWVLQLVILLKAGEDTCAQPGLVRAHSQPSSL